MPNVPGSSQTHPVGSRLRSLTATAMLKAPTAAHITLENSRTKEAALRSSSGFAPVHQGRPLRFLHAFISSSRRFSVSRRRRSAAPQGDFAGRHLVLSKLSRSSSTGFPHLSSGGRSSSRRSVTTGNLSSGATCRRSRLPATGQNLDRGTPRPCARTHALQGRTEVRRRVRTRPGSLVPDRGLPLCVRSRPDGQDGWRIEGHRRRTNGEIRHPRRFGGGSSPHSLAPSYAAYCSYLYSTSRPEPRRPARTLLRTAFLLPNPADGPS